MCRVDRLRLKQVFLDLVFNALQYKRLQGLLGLVVATGDRGRIGVTVSEAGIGMTAQQANQANVLGQRFNRRGRQRGKRAASASGLAVA